MRLRAGTVGTSLSHLPEAALAIRSLLFQKTAEAVLLSPHSAECREDAPGGHLNLEENVVLAFIQGNGPHQGHPDTCWASVIKVGSL